MTDTDHNQRTAIAFDLLVLLALFVFTSRHIPWSLIFLDTLTVGGDTPAHHYLASQLREQLIHSGRIIGWAPGWWCGFPLFQFYFCLPYLIMALLGFVIPHNIAFKLVTIAGIYMLPAAAYASARLMRLPRPTPILLAILMVPFLFVKSHTIWGANIYSTLAGMIANSISFPIMLLTIASWYRDLADGTARLRSVILMALLLASHFFTTLIAVLVIVAVPLLLPRERRRTAFHALLSNGLLASLLGAWWILPLLVKRSFSVDFGTNWNVQLAATIPIALRWALPFALVALVLAFRRRQTAILLIAWMLAVAAFLFRFGYDLSPVFVNIRLWPFIFYALIHLSACGLGLCLTQRRAPWLAVLAVLIAALVYTAEGENRIRDGVGPVRAWAEFNYGGLENRPGAEAFNELVLPLNGTPGRLATDMTAKNNAIGSSRIFEVVPHVIDKPIIEGGLVNSALTSYFSYYIQCETSASCAGFPTLVKPAGFDLDRATHHLKLFNVKHFIARWQGVREAMLASPDWQLLRSAGPWSLFELTTHDGHYVEIPAYQPLVLESPHWAADALDWMYATNLLEQPVIFCIPGACKVREPGWEESLSPEAFRALTGVATNAAGTVEPGQIPFAFQPQRLPPDAKGVTDESIDAGRIRFHTDAIGVPHIIKCSYFPNWKVRGATGVHLVSPSFMLVYPTRPDVELYYGYTAWDRFGQLLTIAGLLLLALRTFRNRRAARNMHSRE